MLLREISLISLQPLSSTCSSVPLEFPVAFSDVHGCVLNLSSQFEGWTPCHVFVPPTEPRKCWQDHWRCWLNDGNIPLGKSRLPAWALSRAAYTVPIPQGVGASTPLPGVATSVQLWGQGCLQQFRNLRCPKTSELRRGQRIWRPPHSTSLFFKWGNWTQRRKWFPPGERAERIPRTPNAKTRFFPLFLSTQGRLQVSLSLWYKTAGVPIAQVVTSSYQLWA